MEDYIKGNYRKSIFHSEKGYVIGLFKIRETNMPSMQDYINKTVTFTGYFHELNEDDTYFFYGEEADHPRYGFQFQVTHYERIKPEDKDGLVEFLSSDLFSGIGEKMAKTIVETLGENALNAILEDEEVLKKVPKLPEKKAHHIYETLMKYEESHQTIVYLTELGFSMRDALNIYNTYRGHTTMILEHNIYRLMDDIQDLEFTKIDEISHQLKIDANDERRIKACIIYIMKELISKNSDTYLEYDDIRNSVSSYLQIEISGEELEQYLSSLAEEDKIQNENEYYYLKDMWESENNIIKKIYNLSNLPLLKQEKLDVAITELEKENEISYNDKQKEAIKKALENNLLIITGGPGTGKTTIIKAIVELYQRLHSYDYDALVSHIALLAPTGRASKRLSESTLLPATTIHRFLKWNKDTNEFAVNQFYKDHSKLVIVDEVSMIDLPLLDSLLLGLDDDIQLILVGDYNQLPSVGPGQVLKDLIESDVIDTVHLDLLYRQDENSYITTLAYEIKNNDLSENFLDTRSDYTFLQCNGVSLRQNLKQLCCTIVEKGYDYKRVQIMAPLYRGENGIDNLNIELQSVFNPSTTDKREIKYGDVIFRENDKILQLVNMPDENVYNGDIGVIKYILYAATSKSGKNEIYVDFDGNVVKYVPKDFIKIKHGFVITIHKSQGSEFELVIMPLCNSYKRMLYQKLVYTGVTRAKKKLILIGEPNALSYSIQNDHERPRKTNLMEKLRTVMNNSLHL